MGVQIEVPEVGGERTSAVRCFHLPNDIQVVYRSDGTIRLQSHSQNIAVVETKNWADGSHLRIVPYDAPAVGKEHPLRSYCVDLRDPESELPQED